MWADPVAATPIRYPRTVLAALLASLGAALVAQRWIDGGETSAGVVLGIAAAAVFGWCSRSIPLTSAATAPAAASARPARRGLVLASVALAIAGTALLEPNRFTPMGTVAWLAGIVLCWVALRDRPRSEREPVRLGAVALLVIVAIGAWLRGYDLLGLPAEAGCDIPLKLQVVRGILAGERPIFSTVYPGREIAFFYATAVYAALFGADQAALKTVAVCFSLATLVAIAVVGTYWFDRAVGLLAATWLALSPWHVTISRIGYRGVMTPFMVALTLLFLGRMLMRRARRDYAALGIVLGAGMYTYTAYGAVLPAVAAVAVVDAVRTPAQVRGWAVSLLFCVMTLLPLARFAAAEPAAFIARAGSRVAEGEQRYALGERLLQNAIASAGMFTVRGDPIATQNAPERRQLGAASGALFMLGLGVAVSRLFRPAWALLIVFLIATQLPSALVLGFPNEVPGAVRASGALVPAYLLVAVPLAAVWRLVTAAEHAPPSRAARPPDRPSVATRAPRPGWVVSLCFFYAAALLLAEAGETWQRYFVAYASAQPFGNYPMTRTIAAVIDDHTAHGEAYLPQYAHWIDGNAVRIQLRRLPNTRYHEIDTATFTALLAAPAGDAPRLFILRPDDEDAAGRLRIAYPNGRAVPHADRHGTPMFVAWYAQ
jgi:4-amino-4-deoxy-L-arabinose transferase-like glycosyltransferase